MDFVYATKGMFKIQIQEFVIAQMFFIHLFLLQAQVKLIAVPLMLP